MTSITSSLGAGSGIDTKALTEQLAAAARAPREAAIAKREELHKARVSALAEAMNGLDAFASALANLQAGGSLSTQPTVSDPSVLSATAKPGARLPATAASLEVARIATAQTLVAAPLANAAAPVGEGELTFTVGGAATTIAITAANNSLAGLAEAINASAAGVTASVLTDSTGARLVLKGRTGEAAAFGVAAAPAAGAPGLERFAYDAAAASGALTRTQAAGDALVRLDGVEVRRATNDVGDLLPGVDLNLLKAAPGTIVAVGVKRPTEALGQAVRDFVDAYNGLRAVVRGAVAGADGKPGPLRGDQSLQELDRELARLPGRALSSVGGYASLAEIGVATNRDGTLRVDAARLTDALGRDPAGVEALFNPTQYAGGPAVAITSRMGRTKPGVYQLTDLVPAADGRPASGKINGITMTAVESRLIAPAASPAVGLIVDVRAAAASVTVTVDPGLGGALAAVRDRLKGATGPYAATSARLAAEQRRIADDRARMERQAESYVARLSATFAGMDARVAAFKATGSYLDQQVKMWTKG